MGWMTTGSLVSYSVWPRGVFWKTGTLVSTPSQYEKDLCLLRVVPSIPGTELSLTLEDISPYRPLGPNRHSPLDNIPSGYMDSLDNNPLGPDHNKQPTRKWADSTPARRLASCHPREERAKSPCQRRMLRLLASEEAGYAM